MRISLAVGGLLAAAVAIVAAVHAQTIQVSANLRSTRPLVLVELYQSQGCSSCPPANANINAIADRPDLVALSFGVTYWDYLGWPRDSFASPEFTQRQWDYDGTTKGEIGGLRSVRLKTDPGRKRADR